MSLKTNVHHVTLENSRKQKPAGIRLRTMTHYIENKISSCQLPEQKTTFNINIQLYIYFSHSWSYIQHGAINWNIMVHTILKKTVLFTSLLGLLSWKLDSFNIYFMYLCRNLRWKSFLTVSLMKRLGVLVSPRAWFLNTTSSSHLRPKQNVHCILIKLTRWRFWLDHRTDQGNIFTNLLFTLKEEAVIGLLSNGFPLRSSASLTLSSSANCSSS